jgi:hypothetical protein
VKGAADHAQEMYHLLLTEDPLADIRYKWEEKAAYMLEINRLSDLDSVQPLDQHVVRLTTSGDLCTFCLTKDWTAENGH